MNEASTLAIIGILGATTGALVWIIKYLFTSFKPVMDNLVRATEENTKATQSADEYLRERNGRDIEFHKEIMVSLKEIPAQAKKQAEQVVEELHRVGDLTAERLVQSAEQTKHQTVTEQTVEHQIVEKNSRG